MRTLCWLLALTAAGTPAAAEEDLPFEAYVVPTAAPVYSGPDEPRYVTHEIPRGTKIEVYEQRDEWLGIRPPEGSFGWVPAAAMKMSQEPGVAAAASGGVAVWIGTSVEKVSEHTSSVNLSRGELVEVLGQKEVASADGGKETWLKIAPPAGEFRWIHASQVSRDAPSAFIVAVPEVPESDQWSSRPVGRRRLTENREETTAESQPRAATGGPFRRSSMELRDLTPVVRPAGFRRELVDSAVQQAAHDAEITEPAATSRPLSADGFVPRQPRPNVGQVSNLPKNGKAPRVATFGAIRSNSSSANPVATAPAPGPATTDPQPDPAAGISSAAVQRRLMEIDTALSLMISGDRSQWNLAALKREVQKLVEQGATPVDRGEARFMIEKIDRFAEAFGIEDDDGTLDLPVGSAAARKAALEAATAPKYDGTGYLTPVRAARPVAPYALLDEHGNRVCYVTPVPGFNLRAYENRQIGVFGKRGYMSDVGASHLLADRVVDLGKQTR